MTPIFLFFYTFASLPNKNTAMSLKSIVILAMIGCLWHSSAAQNPVNMIFGKEKFTRHNPYLSFLYATSGQELFHKRQATDACGIPIGDVATSSG